MDLNALLFVAICGLLGLALNREVAEKSARVFPNWFRYAFCIPFAVGLELLFRGMATRLFLVDEAPGAFSGFAPYASLIAIQILAPLVFVAAATNVVPSHGPVVCAPLSTGRIIPLLLRAVGRFQHVQQFWDAPGLEGFPTW